MRIICIFILLFFGFTACQTNQTDDDANNYQTINSTETQIDLPDTNSIDSSLIVTDTISICLPYPNDVFFNLKLNYFKIDDTTINYSYDEVYWYLITNLDSLAPKNIIEKQMAFDEYEMITKWDQYFSNETHYLRNEGVEGGVTTYLYSHCKDKKQFFTTIAPIIEFQELDSSYYNPKMEWNKDSTRYEPIGQEAGCYYEIKTDSVNNYMLEWYCGC